MKFIVRAGFNAEFINREWNNGVSVVQKYTKLLGDYVKEDLWKTSLTFIAFIAEDENAKACEDHLRGVWADMYPNNQKALSVLMVEDDDSELAKAVRYNYYAYIGWEPVNALCTDWARAYSLVKGKSSIKTFRAMNYLVSIDKGCGFDQMVRCFANFMDNFEMYETLRDQFLTYVVGEEDKNGYTTTDTIMDALWEDDNEYKAAGIDIEYLISEDRLTQLRDFIHNLQKFEQKYIFFLRVPVLSDKALDDVKNIISDIIDLKVIKINPYTDLEIREYAQREMLQQSYETNIDVMNYVVKKAHQEKMDGRFYGFKTINKIVNEIIWEKVKHDAEAKYNGETFDESTITYEDMKKLDFEEKTSKSGFEELDELIGMEEISKRIKEIVAQLLVTINNDKMDRPSLHMRFTGAPGTGKTTVARIVGKIFKEKGILRKGDFFEYEARNLCGEYVGQTAPKTHAICRDAYGSVLFIDEAYALYTGDSEGKDYGSEAIVTLISEMENHRDDMVVIMAGYTDDMDKLMEINSGLRSRMPFIIEFKSYTKDQLADIFMKMANKHFCHELGFKDVVREYFNSLSDAYINSKEFANARFVRNLYERTWAKASIRVSELGMTDILLTKDDFINATQEKEFSEKLMQKKKVGFI